MLTRVGLPGALASLIFCAGLSAQVSEAWRARYDGPVHGDDEARAMQIDAHGNLYITGSSDGDGTASDILTIKYGPDGQELWEARYDGPAHGEDLGRALALDSQGNVYVTGESMGDGTDFDYVLIKYDPHGNELWEQRYDGPDHGADFPVAVALDGYGRVFVTGSSDSDATEFDYATVAYDADGNLLWAVRYDGPASDYDYAAALAVDGHGNVYVTGSSTGDGSLLDYATVKYSPDGEELWVRRYDGPDNYIDIARAMTLDAAGNVYVTGQSTGPSHNFDIATIKYDPAGQELWIQRFNADGARTEDNSGRAVAVDDAGFVYVAGASVNSGIGEYAAVKYDPDGNEVWFQFYRGSGLGANIASAIAVDPAGDVYITGHSPGDGTGPDYATLKYDAFGNVQWIARYDGPAHNEDVANALALDGQGNIYVTGSSVGVGTAQDWATIKYSENPNAGSNGK